MVQTENQLLQHIQSIADTLTNPNYDELNEDRDTENEGDFSAYDYLQDALDIEYIVNNKSEYLGARVLVALGGPNIWIDTRRGKVDGYWWGEAKSVSFTDNIGIDESLRELWECR